MDLAEELEPFTKIVRHESSRLDRVISHYSHGQIMYADELMEFLSALIIINR